MDLEATFRDQAHLPAGEPLVVACSGGADSTALAVLTVRCAAALDLGPVTLAHLDHGLRPDSATDAAHVRELARSLGVQSVIERVSIQREAGESPEAAARRVRYAFLAGVARGAGASSVLAAHHQDDQAETVLLRILRGTGPGGLAAMRCVRPLADGIDLRRPLLGVRAADLRAYLGERGITWCEDPTNRDGNVRARLRHRALPVLAECVERDPVPLLARLAEIAGQAPPPDAALGGAFVSNAPDGIHVHPGAERLPGDVLLPGLAELAGGLRGAPLTHAERARLVRLLRGVPDETVSGLTVERRPGSTQCAVVRVATSPSTPPEARELAVPGSVAWGRVRLLASVVPAGNTPFLDRLRAGPGALELADADAVRSPLHVRGPADGDRFQALGATTAARLGHLLQRRGRPPALGPHVAVVEDADGIVWVPGVALAHRVRVRDGSRRLLRLAIDLTAPPADPENE